MESFEYIRQPRISDVVMSTRPDLFGVKVEVIFTGHHVMLVHQTDEQILYTDVLSVDQQPVPGRGSLLVLTFKNFRTLNLLFTNDKDASDAAYAIRHLSLPKSHEHLFAFQSFARMDPKARNGWELYNPEKEMARLGVPDKKWRVCKINQKFKYCNSYPRNVYIPEDVDDDVVEEIVKFRQGGRFPVLCFRHLKTKAPLLRASQPLVGDKKNSYEDERMFRSILSTIPGCAKGCIFDTRSPSDADKDRNKGGGSEHFIIKKYFKWELKFIRKEPRASRTDSLQKYIEAIKTESSSSMSKINASGYLTTLENLLHGATEVAAVLSEGIPVVVHGGSGRDETLIITSLVQLICDPYYRSLDGFQILIEKEWIEAGHPFSDRYAHFGTTQKKSPVFVIFLDLVWQLCNQYPTVMEFNEDFLLALFDHSQSSEFGTFIFNSVQLKEKHKVKETTTSLWTYTDQPAIRPKFINRLYEAYPGVIRPSWRPQALKTWHGMYQRWNLERMQGDEQQAIVETTAQERDNARALLESTEKKLAELQAAKKQLDQESS